MSLFQRFLRKPRDTRLQQINSRRAELASDDDIRRAAESESLTDCFAAVAVTAERVLGQRPFDVQILGALAMADGKIAEMQTGEGKTLAATMAVVAHARKRGGFHVLTANDYLARRDAEWMGGIYRFLGLSVGFISQSMTPEERRRAYACDITYATPNEVGFDYLRDALALRAEAVVQREFAAVLVDEADAILIDEARIPLVIAGGEAPAHDLAYRAAALVRRFVPGLHYGIAEHGRNVFLTDGGIALAEQELRCPNLYDAANGAVLEMLQNALHAQSLLRRDVDYVVKNGRIELVDEFKGRIAENRRWPAALQTALEAKEGLALQRQGRILGSITLLNLMSLYTHVCGMTGTAATQAAEFKEFYGLEVVEIPANRPVIRVDHPDVVFRTRVEKERAVAEEIASAHAAGRPVLVGTASVEESERLSAMVGVPHEVLNARDDAREARIVARAGSAGAVTISTNMAGRGTDIPLGGAAVAALGGLQVIGTNRHESRRIDRQLRGRAGRQGDPGSSRFFISLEDDLLARYGVAELLPYHSIAGAIETVQRIIEEESLEIRRTLAKYDYLVDAQRRTLRAKRDQLLAAGAPPSDLARIDAAWADHLAAVAELREGGTWISLGVKDPWPVFLHEVSQAFDKILEEADSPGPAEAFERGATWTYVVNDQPFGTPTERLFRGLRRRARELLN